MARTHSSNIVSAMEDGVFWYEETPVGSVNGSNKTFTLSASPNPQSSLELEINGQTVILGASNDYTLSADTITTTIAYPTGQAILRARFRVEPV